MIEYLGISKPKKFANKVTFWVLTSLLFISLFIYYYYLYNREFPFELLTFCTFYNNNNKIPYIHRSKCQYTYIHY